MSFGWEAIPSTFYGTQFDCPGSLCEKVGVVQIFRSKVKYVGAGIDIWHSWWNSHSWKLDEAIPYPEQAGKNVITNPYDNISPEPNTEVGHSAFFTDDPNARKYVLGGVLWSVEFDFELHFICLAGPERGATYGGVEWGFRMERASWGGDSPEDDYSFSGYHRQTYDPSTEWRQIWLANK